MLVNTDFLFICLCFIKNKYKEKYTSSTKGHYEGIDKKTMHAMKARKLASDVSLLFRKLDIV